MSTDGKSSVGIDCADEGNQQILPPHVSGCVHLIGGVPVVSVGVSTKLLPAFSTACRSCEQDSSGGILGCESAPVPIDIHDFYHSSQGGAIVSAGT